MNMMNKTKGKEVNRLCIHSNQISLNGKEEVKKEMCIKNNLYKLILPSAASTPEKMNSKRTNTTITLALVTGQTILKYVRDTLRV